MELELNSYFLGALIPLICWEITLIYDVLIDNKIERKKNE